MFIYYTKAAEIKMKDKLFSIGEIAKSIGITRRIILNYEDKGLIKPDVKEGENGNRYYTIDTFVQIRTIRIFQNLGLSLDEIRGYFSGTTDLIPLIHRLETLRDEINLNIERLYERTEKSSEKIKEIYTDEQTVYKRVFNSVTIAEKTKILRDTALEAMRSCGTDTTKRMYFTEFDIKSPSIVSYCVAVPPHSEGKYISLFPSLRAICTFYHGPYENLFSAAERLIEYAKENNLQLSGVCRYVYLEGPPQHTDKSKFITQVVMPII